LEGYYRAETSKIERAVINAAAKKYSKALSDHFRQDERARLIYGYVTAAAGVAVGIPLAPLGTWIGAGVGLAVGVATVIADQTGAPRAIMKIMSGNDKKWIGTTLGARPTMVSNFQIDQSAADVYRRGVQEFRRP